MGRSGESPEDVDTDHCLGSRGDSWVEGSMRQMGTVGWENGRYMAARPSSSPGLSVSYVQGCGDARNQQSSRWQDNSIQIVDSGLLRRAVISHRT